MRTSPAETAAAATSDIFTSTFLVGHVGAPFVIGLAVGYFAKKMLRTTLFLAGAAIVLLFVAEHYGIVNITEAKLQEAASATKQAVQSSGGMLIDRLNSFTNMGSDNATTLVQNGVSGVGAIGGFFLGFKLG